MAMLLRDSVFNITMYLIKTCYSYPISYVPDSVVIVFIIKQLFMTIICKYVVF